MQRKSRDHQRSAPDQRFAARADQRIHAVNQRKRSDDATAIAQFEPRRAAGDIGQQRRCGRKQNRERKDCHQRVRVVRGDQQTRQYRAYQDSGARCALRIEGHERFRKQAVVRRRHRHLRRQQHPAVERADAGDRSDDGDTGAGSGAPQRFRGVGHRRCGCFGHVRRQQPEYGGAGEDGRDTCQQRADQRGAGDRAFGVVDRAGGDGGRFQAKEGPQRQCHCGANRGGHRDRRIIDHRFGGGLQILRFDPPDRDAAEQQQRDELQNGGGHLHASGFANSGEIDRRTQPQRGQRNRRAAHRRDDQCGKQTAQTACESHCDRRVGAPDRDPVTPGDDETGGVAEGFTRVRIRTARMSAACGQAREGQREQKRTAEGDAPADQADRTIRRKRSGQQKHAAADHVAHNQCDRGPEAERAMRCAHTPSTNALVGATEVATDRRQVSTKAWIVLSFAVGGESWSRLPSLLQKRLACAAVIGLRGMCDAAVRGNDARRSRAMDSIGRLRTNRKPARAARLRRS